MLDRRTFLGAVVAASTGAAALPGRAQTRAAASPGFPAGFLWGAATAGHQVEGNNVNSDVWAMEHARPTVYMEPSGDAVNSFTLWPTDLDIAKAMGLNTYRFSLEWARIEPAPGEFSLAMLDHYKAMIAGCRARGLVPMVTFNHFTTPVWFAAQGGWSNPQAPSLFGRYCERAARHLASGMGYATTLNEPNLSGLLDVVLPGGIGKQLLSADKAMQEAAAREHGVARFLPGNPLYVADPHIVQAHLLAGHQAGRAAIKAARPDLPVGVSLAIIDDQAANGSGGGMRDTMREKLYGAWLRAARGDEFVGVQNYERAVWDDSGRVAAPKGVETNDAGEEIYPASLAGAVRHAHAVSGVPVIVTEHGVNSADDSKRARLIPAALAELKRAMDDGVPVLGYVHWSLVDNFEWVFGYKPQFGLHSFDRTTFRRSPKASAAVLGRIARNNAL
jgi:beta-glucosidase